MKFPELRNVLHTEGNDVTEGAFNVAVSMLPDRIKDWKDPKLVELLKIMGSGDSPLIHDAQADSNLELFNLPKTVFICSKACCRREVRSFDPRGDNKTKWSFDYPEYRVDACQVVERAIIAAGRDPNATTTYEMDKLDARFYCRDYPRGPNLITIKKNKCATHVAEQPPSEFTGWIRVFETKTAKVIQIEYNNAQSPEDRLRLKVHVKAVRSNHNVTASDSTDTNELMESYADL
ncbi:hypothetical protein FRB96_006394 [Tulasnella sp. 330]|nr:hypothetical protein FRB96_006394 [Tulasnella sp. 330]